MQTSFPPNPIVTNTVFAAGRKFDWDGNTWVQNPQFTAMEQTVMVCVNKTGSDILKGQVLYYDGHQQGLPLVGVADSSDEAKSGLIIGVAAEDFATDMEGLVVTFGKLRGMDTSVFQDADEVWLNTSGGLTAAEPTTGGIRVGYVIASHQYDGVLFVDMDQAAAATDGDDGDDGDDGGDGTTTTGPYGVVGFLPGKYYANDLVLLHVAAWPITFPAGLACSKAAVLTGSTSQVVLDIQKNGASAGSITFAPGALTGTYASALDIMLSPGDLLSVIAPATEDATMADLTLTIAGERTGGCPSVEPPPPPPSGADFILYAVYNDTRSDSRLLQESGGVITECILPEGFRPTSVSPSQRLGLFGSVSQGIIVGGSSSADFGATAISSMDAGETWETVSWGNGQQLETPCVGVISLGNLVATEDYYNAYSYSPTANGAWVYANESPGWQWFRLCALADFKSQLYAAFIEGPDGQMAIRRTSSITPGSWETVDAGDISITQSNFLYFATDGNRLMLVSENGHVRYSDNGASWTTLPTQVPGRFNAAICGDGKVVLVGLNDTDVPNGTDYPHQIFVAAITDLNFSAYTVPGRLINSENYNEKYFIDVTFGNGQFTALAVDGTVIKFTNPNTINVSTLTAPAGGWFCGVKFFEGPPA